jgi:hypothetical protein
MANAVDIHGRVIGLDVTHVNRSGEAFFGFGITIPTNAVNKK